MTKMPPRVKYRDTMLLYRVWNERMAIRASTRAAHLMPEDWWSLSVRDSLRSSENAGVPSEVQTTFTSSMYTGAVT